jgi:TRAP-type C4-dicarboxylate transport system substrate-binding protein
VLLLVCVIALGAAAHAAPPAGLIKLGTIAPTDSSFHKILTAMGTKWSQIPGGPSLRIYAGGTAGGEADMVMKMKIGQIDAALLSAEGLAEVDPAVKSVQCIPMMFHSLEEVDYVVEKIGPRLDQRLREKGFVVLFWGDAGWVRFFSTSVVRSPDDLKKTKLFTWAGDTQTFDIYKSAGFHPVALETADILPMLRTGMINAAPLPPYVALSTQVYSGAKNMIALNWAPLVGALVITERAWNRLPPAAQLAMARAAVEAGREIKKQNRSESDRAVEAMKKLGLNVYEPTPAVEAVWRATAEVTYPKIRGGLVPSAYFDEVQRLIEQYRATVRTP